jgi:hypothetical protein
MGGQGSRAEKIPYAELGILCRVLNYAELLGRFLQKPSKLSGFVFYYSA